MAGRGYDRLVNHAEYLLLGAGEGSYNRFQSELPGSELHSSYGTLLFCYGLVGALLFSLALLLVCGLQVRWMLYLSPVMLFGLFHHGLRFTLFWVLLAYVCCLAWSKLQPAGRCSDPGLAR